VNWWASRIRSIIVLVDKTVRKYSSFEAMKADEYRSWQEMRPHERLDAAAELSMGAYRMKEPSGNVPARLQRTLVRLQHPES
jgi:hypothetical protein